MKKSFPLHGRDHRPGGSDPIPGLGEGGIQFDTDNVGGYLSVETTGNTAFIVDGDSSGTWSVKDKLVGDFMLYVEPGSRDVWMRGLPSFTIDYAGQLQVNNHSDAEIMSITDAGRINMSGHILDVTADSWISISCPDGDFDIGCSGSYFNLYADNGCDFTINGSGRILLTANGNCEVHLADDGEKFRVTRASSPLREIFVVEEDATVTVWNGTGNAIFRIDPDGSVHGITGGSITWDL